VIGRRNIIIAISSIVVFAAIVGFIITLDVSPQIAYARLFIDAGLVIGAIAVVMAFYREPSIPTEGIVNALNHLTAGKYKTRISPENLSPLNDIIKAVNDLAKTLESNYEKQEEIKRNLREELLPDFKSKEPLVFEHSYHPELGPVHSLPYISNNNIPKAKEPKNLQDIIPKPISSGNQLNNTLIESSPPKMEERKQDINVVLNRQEQDLGELYQRFIDEQRLLNIDQIEYQLFLKTIEKTKKELMSSYKCQGIFFDIVKKKEQVALQPKIIR
jgi:hypothetical protein